MGTCVSTHRHQRAPAPADIPSPVKLTAVNGGDALKTQWSDSQSKPTVRDYGSKDDVFFDSKAWIDSDCEDDFFSVNGDFTPSRGNTPVHHSFKSTPRVSKTPTVTTAVAPASIPEPSPNSKKKKLAELFRDSIGRDEEAPALTADDDESKASPGNKASEPPKASSTTILDILPNSEHGSPHVSGANSLGNSEQVPNGNDTHVHQRCLPSLMSCRVSVDRRKKLPPPIPVHD